MTVVESKQEAAEQGKLAIDGGPKTFEGRTGESEPKIGVDEFLSIARRFGFNAGAIERIRGAVSNDDIRGGTANLARYYCPYPELLSGPRFEAMAREKFGVKHALGVSSGTAALHSAFVAVGAGPGTEVIVPAVGFMATAAAAGLAGATVVFCDVDESLQIDPTKIEPLITEKTIAVAPTHHWGGICDMGPILAVARKHNLRVIEDCAQSPGGKYRGRYVGSMGDVGCFSISAYKIIGGGEGGMVVTSDARLFDRINQFAECGGLWRENRFAAPRYEGELFVGTNYRLSELEASVNVVQLEKLDGVVRRHHDVKMRILRQLKTYREIVPQRMNDVEGEVGYLLRFYPQTHELATRIATALTAEGIGAHTRGPGAAPDWHIASEMFPLACSNCARNIGKGDCPVAEDLYNRCVGLMLDQWYSPADCDAIAAGINKVLSGYCTADERATRWV